jgi:hypothetical protein
LNDYRLSERRAQRCTQAAQKKPSDEMARDEMAVRVDTIELFFGHF